MRSNLHRFVLLLTLLLGAAWTAPLRAQEAYAVLDDAGTLTFYYDAMRSTRTGTQYGVPTDGNPAWAGSEITPNTTILTVDFNASFADFTGLTSLYSWFQWCKSLQEIRHLEHLNTEKVTNMSYMFYGCSALTSLDLTSFNTANV